VFYLRCIFIPKPQKYRTPCSDSCKVFFAGMSPMTACHQLQPKGWESVPPDHGKNRWLCCRFTTSEAEFSLSNIL